MQAFVASACFQEATHIASYLAYDSELDTRGIIQAIWEAGKHCYLPVVNKESKDMAFLRYEENTVLLSNDYGILEPSQSTLIQKTALDIVLVPLLAFDQAGYRLGMGAGFYDRAFADLADATHHTKPLLIGLAYSQQETDDVFHDSWDIPIHAVVTELGVRWFSE